jgi:N-terminal half of MaoC dehydratase
MAAPVSAVRFPVEAGAVQQFARAIGDPNPIYHDEDFARTTDVGGVIAPPTFTMSSLQWEPPRTRLRPVPGQPWLGSGREPSGDPPDGDGAEGVGLHAEQHFEYHRHVGPGDVLTATESTGRTWERQGRRGGHMRFTEFVTEYRDQLGELVITARRIGVRVERAPGEVER